MSARVERPDLEGLRDTYLIATRCVDPRITSSATVTLGVIAYALQLEQDAAGLRAVADAAAAWKDGTNFRRCDYRCQHVDCALAALLAAAP